MSLRIAIVHHDLSVRNILRKVISAAPDYELRWLVGSGREALEQCRQNRPDLLLVDLALKDMDGARLVCEIMRKSPCAILLLTDEPDERAGKVFEAMGCGALDAVKTPSFPSSDVWGGGYLLKKIAMLSKILARREKPGRLHLQRRNLPRLVAVGASTGGPKALAAIFSAFPADLQASVVVVQHLDLQFARGLSTWLDSQTRLPVRLIEEGMSPLAGQILIAGTNDHLVIGEDLAFHYISEPKEYPYRPSVNVFFESLNKYWPLRDVAALLTGMGRDGASGMAILKKAGWHTITQDQKTSVVYGMPAAAVEMDGSVESLPLEEIAGAILKKLSPVTSAGIRK